MEKNMDLYRQQVKLLFNINCFILTKLLMYLILANVTWASKSIQNMIDVY